MARRVTAYKNPRSKKSQLPCAAAEESLANDMFKLKTTDYDIYMRLGQGNLKIVFDATFKYNLKHKKWQELVTSLQRSSLEMHVPPERSNSVRKRI